MANPKAEKGPALKEPPLRNPGQSADRMALDLIGERVIVWVMDFPPDGGRAGFVFHLRRASYSTGLW